MEAGETLYSIARIYRTTVSALRQWNPFLADRSLEAGDVLMIQQIVPEFAFLSCIEPTFRRKIPTEIASGNGAWAARKASNIGQVFQSAARLDKRRHSVYKRRRGKAIRHSPTLTEERMFYAKMHDEEDDELPRYEEDDEAQEQPGDVVEEIEEITITEVEPEEEEAEAPAVPRRAQACRRTETGGEEASGQKEGQGQAQERRQKRKRRRRANRRPRRRRARKRKKR